MIRNLKALGLALMALLAFGAVMASGASAQEKGWLTSDGPVTLTGTEVGTGENRLTAFGGNIECADSLYTGHAVLTHEQTTLGAKHEPLPAKSTTATLTPHYKETTGPGVTPTEGEPNCKGPLGVRATIDMNGCDYVIHLGDTTPAENNEGTYGVTFDVICPSEQTITVTLWKSETEHTNNPSTPFCDMHVGEQKGLTGAHATDEGGHVKLSGEIINIKATRTLTHGEPGLLCSNGSTETAKFDLNVTVSGHDGNEPGKETAISISEE